jgi:thiosulfate/3-mercaptopyruvate sulfurtransferase
MTEYVHPEMLVSTDWVAQQLTDPKVRIVESDEDVLLYDIGHVPGAVKIDWHTDLNDPLVRDYLNAEQFSALLQAKGIDADTTAVATATRTTGGSTGGLQVVRFQRCAHHEWRAQEMDRRRARIDQGRARLPQDELSGTAAGRSSDSRLP